MADIDQDFEDRLREAYIGFGPMMVSSIARQEHQKVLERDEFLKEFIEWIVYMGFDQGPGLQLRTKALKLLGLEHNPHFERAEGDNGEGI